MARAKVSVASDVFISGRKAIFSSSVGKAEYRLRKRKSSRFEGDLMARSDPGTLYLSFRSPLGSLSAPGTQIKSTQIALSTQIKCTPGALQDKK